MKFVLAPDSFKESMTAPEAVAAMRRGVRAVFPHAECVGAPMADGGEGTTDALVDALGGEVVRAAVHDALGRPITARYGYVSAERLAIIEVAAAAGIDLVTIADRDPRIASSSGVGELISDALARGATRFVIGLGGTVTNDGGAGMLQQLGVRFLDSEGVELPRGAAALARLASVDTSGFDSRAAGSTFQIASDVTNPLLGATGASAVFGPQKGATTAMVRELDMALGVYAAVVSAVTHRDESRRPGAGAAGGIGYAFLTFFRSEMRRGIDVVMDATRFSDQVRGADYVFTGEGSIDSQTVNGKSPFGVAETAAEQGVPVIAFGGRIGPGASVLYAHGVHALVPIVQGVSDLPTALTDGAANLERAVATTCRLLNLSIHRGERRP
jgi:glycerate kinase